MVVFVSALPLQWAWTVQSISGFIVYIIFKRYEPDELLTAAFLLIGLPAILGFLSGHISLISAVSSSFFVHYATILTLVLIYRLGPWHPLANYPGPIWCKVSMMHMALKVVGGKRHEYIRALHDKYGDIVRSGPNEVSIRDSSAIAALMGPAGLPKGPMWYGRSNNPASLPLVAQQNPVEHLRRRKPWNRAFATSTVKTYEPLVAKRVTQFVDTVKGQGGVVNLTKWIDYFSFDVMSDMAFGGGSELMHDGDTDGFRWLMDEAMRPTAILEAIPWARRLLAFSPRYFRNILAFRKLSAGKVIRRVQAGSNTKDLFHYLNNEDGAEAVSPPLPTIISDATTAVVAGSDTAASVLCCAFFFILTHMVIYSKLKEEVDRYYPLGEDPCNTQHFTKMVYLDAVINETMRLCPPVSAGTQREVPAKTGGKLIGPYFIPNGTTVRVHTFSVHRDPRNFAPHTETFWPERWILATDNFGKENHPEFVHNIQAFVPFSYGPASCVGKNLAMLEMRMLLCACIQQLDFQLTGDLVNDPGRWKRELCDYFVLQKGHLPVLVTERTKN